MKNGILNRCAVLFLALTLFFSCLPTARAETTLLPPTALILRQELMTGGMLIKAPELTVNALTAPEVDMLNELMSAYTPPETTLLVNASTYYYYYEQLDPVAKEIYDLLLQLARDPVSEGNIQVMMTPLDPTTEDFEFAYLRAHYAVTLDHPELFWMYFFSGETEVSVEYRFRPVNGRYIVFFSMSEPFDAFEEQMAAFNNAATAFLANIDRSASDYEIVKQIHDHLMDLTTYDIDVCNRNASDLAHSAYGVLVENSAGIPNYAVCDGYSLAFEYLLQQCGIRATVVGGEGGKSPYEMGGHAWSLVNLDGEWYEVDSTWDDNAIDEGMLESLRGDPSYDLWLELIHDPVIRERWGHRLFLISSDKMEHYTAPTDVDWSFTFSNGYGPVDVPPDECYHVRMSEGMTTRYDSDYFQAMVIYLAPRAEHDYPQ